MQRIIATLGLKETTQSTLVKKLCTYQQDQKTRDALFEFDKLIRSIHTLKCLLDPSIQRNTHRSQDRVEAYHQLRSEIAQAYGKKQLLGKTNSALEISNQCGRKKILAQNPKVQMAKRMHKNHGMSIDDICKTLNISRASFYRYLTLDE